MCVVQRVHLRVVLVGSYILHLGVHVVLLFWRCCTSYCNLSASLLEGGGFCEAKDGGSLPAMKGEVDMSDSEWTEGL